MVLHFADNNIVSNDPCYKVRSIIDHFRQAFKAPYYPGRELSIDESMCAFKGRLGIKQYMPMKHHRFGIKNWVMCESATGYTFDFYPYIPEKQDERLGSSVVKIFTEPLKDRGHHVYMDRFFSNPCLFKELKEMGTGACGTVNASTVNMPAEFKKDKVKKIIKKGSAPRFMEDGAVVAVAWFDKKPITAMSTIHPATTVTKKLRSKKHPSGFRVIEKPSLIEAYNQHMGGVDRSDQNAVYYKYCHRSKKWYMTYFYNLREKAIINAHVLYKAANSSKSRSEVLDGKMFRLMIADGLLKVANTGTPYRLMPVSTPESLPLRLNRQPTHWLENISGIAKPDCIVCSSRKDHQRHQTRYRCKVCCVPLCPVVCHERYHTLKEYRIRYTTEEE